MTKTAANPIVKDLKRKTKGKKASSNWAALKASLDENKKKKVENGEGSKFIPNFVPKKRKSFRDVGSSALQGKVENVWFDNVEPELIEDIERVEKAGTLALDKKLIKTKSFEGVTKALAMDCEMVGVGVTGERSILARVSLVNQNGHMVYDKFVRPREPVTQYRTHVSGVRAEDLTEENATDFDVVQKEVSDLITGRILVGHALHNDMKVLYLDHPKKNIRDTQRYRPFKTLMKSKTPSLRKLCIKVLNIDMQKGEHSSVTDSQAAMRLYTMHKKEWEADVRKPHLKKKKRT